MKKIDENRWKQAQDFELESALKSAILEDDFNFWWKSTFKDYNALKGQTFNNVLEVGCGPHTNVRLILPLISCTNLFLEDPLIHQYLGIRRIKRFFGFLPKITKPAVYNLVKKYKSTLLSEKLEDLSLPNNCIDLLICINVLDHVEDLNKCFFQIFRVLRPGGMLVLGQDLTNQTDYIQCPETLSDIGHPIKLDHNEIESVLLNYVPIIKNIIPREEGRNPKCHYGTYIFIGTKNGDN